MDASKDLFGEYSSRILLATKQASDLVRRAERAALRCMEIGRVGGNRLVLEHGGRRVVDLSIEELESVWRRALPKLLS
jgi:hypothetical protein